MLTRHAPLLLLFFLVCIQDIARAEQSPPTSVVITLPTATRYGGIRIPLPPPAARQRTVSLALAGGGARAAASIGVLRVLEQEGIPIAAIAGTSMGAGIGGLYAAGHSPDEIERIFLSNDWNDIFRDTPPRAFLTQEQKEAGIRHLLEFQFEGGRLVPPSGLTAGQKLTNLLANSTLAASFEANMDFDRLRVPFRALATDIENGEAVPIGRGLLHDAMRASAAIPLVFQPVEIEGRLFVDGGMSNNLPVEVARSLGGDIVIAVDPSSPLERKDQLQSLIDIFNQAISLQVRPETDRQARLADLLIVPRTDAFSFADFPSMAEIVRTGEEAARAALPRIRELLQQTTDQPEQKRYRITDLAVRGAEGEEAMVRLALSAVLAPREVTEQDILAALAGVSLSGTISDMVIELSPSGRAYHAVLTVRTNPVVTAIDVSGNTILTSTEIRELLAWQVGLPLNGARLLEELDKIVRRLRVQGYLLARVEHAGLLADGHTLGIVFSEGMVNSISYRGQPRTRRSLIQRETVTRAGKPLNFFAAADDIQHLYALDYFKAIDADLSRSPGGGVDIRLNIREKPSHRIRLGLRYDLEDSFTGLTDIVSDNITGRGIKAFLYTRYGNYTDIAAGYTSPVIIRSYFLHTVQAFYRQRDYLIYADQDEVDELDVRRSGVDFAFGYQWFRFGDTYLRYRYSSDRTRSLKGAVDAAAQTHTGSLAFLSTIDTQDRRTFPRTGLLLKGSYESAAPAYGGNQEYRKTSLSADGCMTLAGRHTFLLAITAGFGSGTLPYQEKFGIGGADGLLGFPLPGYHRREFVGMNELGALATYRWRMAEYQLAAVKALYFAVSGGGANVWDVRDDMSPQDLWTGAGIGLHADTLIGPVRLDFGAGEDRRYLVYFSAGFDF